jgi:hypothetical protein
MCVVCVVVCECDDPVLGRDKLCGSRLWLRKFVKFFKFCLQPQRTTTYDLMMLFDLQNPSYSVKL